MVTEKRGGGSDYDDNNNNNNIGERSSGVDVENANIDGLIELA